MYRQFEYIKKKESNIMRTPDLVAEFRKEIKYSRTHCASSDLGEKSSGDRKMESEREKKFS